MTLMAKAWAHDAVQSQAVDARALAEAIAGHNGIAATPGVLNGFKITAQGSPNATVVVQGGKMLVAASGAGLGFDYFVYNDALLASGSFTATTTNGRKDRLILRVTAGVPAIEIVQGTASGSPAEPSITGDNYLELALVTLPSSTTNITNAMITDRRVFVGRWAQSWGYINDASGTNWAASSGAASYTDVTNGTISFTAVAGRRYRYTIQGHTFSNVDGDSMRVQLTDGSNSAKGTPSVWCPIANGATKAAFFSAVAYESIATAGTVTRKLRFQRETGTGTCQFFSDATRLASILVEDIGPSSNPD